VLDHRELSFRSQNHLAVVRIIAQTLATVDAFLQKREFVEIKTAKIVAGGTEGGAGLFEIKYFERAAFLAQSPQLYKQIMASTPLERVFEIGPVFRAEKHATGRHLNEFTGVDVEMAFPLGMDEVIGVGADLVRVVVENLRVSCASDIELLGSELPVVPESVPHLSLDEAKEVATGEKPNRSKPAEHLSPEDERAICDWAKRERGCDLVVVTGWPARSRPFYTMPGRSPGRSESFDLLLGGLEICSGGLRVHDPEILEFNLRKQGLDPDQMESYVRIFRTGCPPHGGFGIGLERLVQMILGLPNVRNASLFPRDRHRIAP